ncbi:MAG: hypothetical protein ACOH2M_09760 [Cypionkella sp.]
MAPSEPLRYGLEIALMEQMHWDYWTLLAQPADLVQVLIERMLAERHWRSEYKRVHGE